MVIFILEKWGQSRNDVKNGYRASGHEHLELDEKTLII